jgi:molybdopterin converting factor small subunit
MQIQIQLFSVLRECLPPDAEGHSARDGKTVVTLPEGATVADLLSHLGIDRYLGVEAQALIEKAGWQVLINGVYEPDVRRALQDGDLVLVFPPISGG